MESINGINTVYGTLHCGTSPGKLRWMKTWKDVSATNYLL
jgi:hypothetical protein